LDRSGKSESQIIVYDLGGGTFDVSLLSIEDGVFEVLATAGDTHLGGEDFDNRVIDYFVKEYKKKSGSDVSANKRAMGKLKREVEKAKRTLSNQQSVRVEIEAFENGNDFSETLTRAKFEELNMDLFRKTMKPVEQVLKDAGVKKDQIDDVSSVRRPPENCHLILRDLSRSSWLVVPPVSPRFSSSSRTSSTERNPPRVSTPMRPSLTELPFREESSVERRVALTCC
jgi:hypothetical protein